MYLLLNPSPHSVQVNLYWPVCTDRWCRKLSLPENVLVQNSHWNFTPWCALICLSYASLLLYPLPHSSQKKLNSPVCSSMWYFSPIFVFSSFPQTGHIYLADSIAVHRSMFCKMISMVNSLEHVSNRNAFVTISTLVKPPTNRQGKKYKQWKKGNIPHMMQNQHPKLTWHTL